MTSRIGPYRTVMVSGFAALVLALTPTAGVRSSVAGEGAPAALGQEDERPRGEDPQQPRGEEDEKPRGHDRPT
jgi:hypothetical protein